MDPAAAMELKILSHQNTINDVIDRGDSPVQQFYKDSTVFVTGGTGFLGKQLIEKLFRACNIGKLYLLIRPKKNRMIAERLQQMLEDPVFDMVRKKYPQFEEKIVPVTGDVAELKLGLSDNDWNTIAQEVEIIFNVAATTRFDEPLRVATLINVRGTREALTLGQACAKLRSFVHVSSTYANAQEKTMDNEVMETFHPCAVPPDVMIELVENLDENKLKNIQTKFLIDYPNTYTFTKSIAEEAVRRCVDKIPVCIVRPAIVVPSYLEPTPGWLDMSCVYSGSGLVLGPALGLMHVIYADHNVQFSFVPVDLVNNVIIVAAYDRAKDGVNVDGKIFAVSSARNLCSYRHLIKKFDHLTKEIPTPAAMWYTYVFSTSNKILFFIYSWILHYIPAYIADGICVLLKKKPILIKVYQKMYKISLTLSYFTTRTWIFNDSNTNKLYQNLSNNDKIIFNCDSTSVDLDDYVNIWAIGLRKYVIKDGLQNTLYARKKQFWLHKLHVILICLFFYIFWKILSFILCF